MPVIHLVTAEDVKRTLLAYQMQHHPEGRCASAMFDCGTNLPPETLVVTAGDGSSHAMRRGATVRSAGSRPSMCALADLCGSTSVDPSSAAGC